MGKGAQPAEGLQGLEVNRAQKTRPRCGRRGVTHAGAGGRVPWDHMPSQSECGWWERHCRRVPKGRGWLEVQKAGAGWGNTVQELASRT